MMCASKLDSQFAGHVGGVALADIPISRTDPFMISSRVTRRRLGASLAQRVDEALAICIIHGDPFAPVTTIHDVRQQTRPSICGLGRESGFGRYIYQYQELTPLPA